jgi:hypothetical protein
MADSERASRFHLVVTFMDGIPYQEHLETYELRQRAVICWTYDNDLLSVTSNDQVFVIPLNRLISLRYAKELDEQEEGTNDG